MSTPVITSKWAGTFECGTCRRKRLMGEEFSKKALERHRKDGGPLKCKQCGAAAEQAERDQAEARRKSKGQGQDAASKDGAESIEIRKCAGVCGKKLAKSAFNRNQWAKGEEKSRCRDCVELAIKAETDQQEKSKEGKIVAARQKVDDARASGSAAKILAAESEMAALEAEKVTGLKAVKLSAGRGRRGGGRGRGIVSGR